MLQLYDLNKNKISGLTKYKDLKIENTLSTGDKVLSFSYPKNLSRSIAEEGYIRTKTDEYVIKQLVKNYDDYITVSCNLNLEELEGKVWDSFSSVEQTVDSAIKLAIAGTGWTVKNNGVTKKRTIRKTGCSALNVIQQCVKTYNCEIKYDSINKIINVYESIGSDKGCYFTDQLNLKELSIQSDSYNFYTIIEAYGKNAIHCTVENYQYSKKKKALYWKDERYTVLADLKEDATLKLKELSTPTRAYKASIYDLARLSDKYKNILDYALGDTITLISKDTDTKLKQRIVKAVEYPDNPESNTVEISNTFASFEDIQKEQQDTTDTVNNITEDNGTISIKALQSGWIELNKVNVQEFNAVKANIGTLNANEVIADCLHANKASINDLAVNKANITDLTASNIKFGTGQGGTLDLQSLLSRFVSGNNAQFLNLTGDNVVIANAIIKDAMIDSVNASKINTGSIDTEKVNIQSKDGALKLWGDLLQFKDKDGNVRIQMGLDGNKVYSLKIADEKGNILFDTDGATATGLHNGIITDEKVADNANINGKKIDINSLITEINNGTSIIKSSKVQLDTEGQTLDVAFNALKSNVDNIHVGARNLVPNSNASMPYATIWDNNMSLNTHDFYINNTAKMFCIKTMANSELFSYTKRFNIEPNTQYTLSFKGFAGDNVNSMDVFLLGRKKGSTNRWDDVHLLIDRKILSCDHCEYITVTFTTHSNIDEAMIRFDNNGSKDGRIALLFFNEVKLEKGNKATDWTPAPDDTQEQITANTTKIGVNQGKIDTLIKDTTITKDGKDIKLKDAYSSLEQSVNGFETKVSNAKTEAINTASTDATAKANKALSDSKGYTDNSINTVTKRVTTAESSIKQLSDSITQKVSKTEFENLQIGGSNLLKNTRDFTGVYGASQIIDDKYNGCAIRYFKNNNSSSGSQEIAEWTCVLYPELGGVYTLSFWAKGIGAIHTYFHGDTNCLQVKSYISSEGSKSSAGNGDCQFNLTDNWKRYWVTYTLEDTGNTDVYKHVLFRHCNNSTSDEVYICGVKLEKGHKATSWTPAPEDTQKQIDNVVQRVSTAEQKITPDAIVSTVTSSTTYKNNLNSKVDTVTYNSKVEQLSNIINSKVSTTDFNSYKTQTATEISNKVSKGDFGSMITQNANSVKVAFGNVGNGENLVKNGNGTFGLNNWNKWSGFSSTSTFTNYGIKWFYIVAGSADTGENMVYQDVEVSPNTTYTFSCSTHVGDGVKSYDIFVTGGKSEGRWDYIRNPVLAGTTDQNVAYTFTTNPDETYVRIRFDNNGYKAGTSHSFSFTNVKLEVGDKKTPFCLAFGESKSANVQIDATGVNLYNGAFKVFRPDGKQVVSVNTKGVEMIGQFLQWNEGTNAKSISIENNQLRLYDWGTTYGTSNYLGGMSCVNYHDPMDDHLRACVAIHGTSTRNHAIVMGWLNDENGTLSEAVNIDPIEDDSATTWFGNNFRHGVIGIRKSVAVWPLTPIEFMYIPASGNANRTANVYSNSSGNLVTLMRDKSAKLRIAYGTVGSNHMNSSWDGIADFSGTEVSIYSPFKCYSSKSRVCVTSYGDVELGAYETPTPSFGDYGESVIGEDGTVSIPIDPIMLECANTSIAYQVFLSAYGDGQLATIERNPQYFIVKGTAGLKFAWEIKIKQKGYENDRFKRTARTA